MFAQWNAVLMPIQVDKAIAEIDKFLDVSAPSEVQSRSGGRPYKKRMAPESEIFPAAAVVETIFGRVMPDWRDYSTPTASSGRIDRWDDHVEIAHRVRTLLERQGEIEEILGDDAPQLVASNLHPWIWEGAKSLWSTGHYREAVGIGAAIRLNAEVQNKVGRKDISEIDLFNQCFSTDAPKPGKPRLRLMADDGSPTFSSLHRGVRSFAEGCYAAIRNPVSHTAGELAEDEALEQLAAFSVLARWVDKAVVEK